MNSIQDLRFISILVLLCLLGHLTNAQVRPGIKFGLSTTDVSARDFTVTDENDVTLYEIFVEKAKYGVHAGGFVQFQMGSFFIQPEVLYNSSNVEYKIDSFYSQGMVTNIFKDTYRHIDFPLMVGLKLGAVRLGVGPVGHIFLSNNGIFGNYENFEVFFDELRWGYQAGVGLDFWKLHIDARYEGNFSETSDHFTFFGEDYYFDTGKSRLIASLGFSF
jgi:hypothetical protein